MLSNVDFVRQSLELHLFFMRIMKEHSFFLEASFTPKDARYAREADMLRRRFDELFAEVIALSNGVVSPEVLQSGEVVTPYTLGAESASSFYTGIPIPAQLTQAEYRLVGGDRASVSPMLAQRVGDLNQRAMELISALIKFKTTVLSNVLSCRMFTANYPLLIDHILREAKLYLSIVQRLQRRESVNIEKEAYEQELFWNQIMAEHSKFIRGLLDPTEVNLFNTADNFGKEFDRLAAEARAAIDRSLPISKVTEDSYNATQRIRDFNSQGTQGLLDCKIRSIILPLLGDHVLRESSHYLRLLKIFSNPVGSL